MKALFFSDHSNLAIHINRDLNDIGIESYLIASNIPEDLVSGSTVSLKRTPYHKLDWFINATRSFLYRHLVLKANAEYGYYQDISENYDYFNVNYIKSKIDKKPKFIFILFDYRILTTHTINKLYSHYKVPIYWLIVDMKPMTGGCSYSLECMKYQTDCNDCPAIGSTLFKCYAAKTLAKKNSNLANVDLNVVTFSSAQHNQAINSTLFKNHKIHKFFFPINKNIFKPMEMSESRTLLNLCKTKQIIFFGSSTFKEPRKGFKYLKQALLKLAKNDCSNLLLLVAGDVNIDELNEIDIDKVILGNVNMNVLANAYQASNIFVCPSIADSGPTMVNQSIMCSTPVIAFNIGVSSDLVITKKTGYLLEPGDSDGLYNGIKYILDLNIQEYQTMRSNCLNMSIFMEENGLLNNIFKLLEPYR